MDRVEEHTKRGELLDHAKVTITQARNKEYGGPEDSFELIAEFWSSYLARVNRTQLSSGDVAAMMVLLKTARLGTTIDHLDSWVDIAGYAGCGGEVSGAMNHVEEKRESPAYNDPYRVVRTQ